MKLSIITVNRNNAAGLEKTIQSVVCQTSDDFEYIVIDGNSDDGSVDIIKKYADKIDYWVSEPDSGIYNAMNKGIRKAQGEYCLFLNSGDCLIEPGTLTNVFTEIAGLGDAGIYYSDILKKDGKIAKEPKNIDISFLIFYPINHQNSLINRDLFSLHGLYNEKLPICADWEWWLQECWSYKTQFTHINTCIALYDMSGTSSVIQWQTHKEQMYRNVFGNLSDLILEFIAYRKSLYGEIITKYGNTGILTFLLKSYRYIIKRIKKGK
jgi:glycosyltransferase involved in cell wall biosynthesis